MAYILASRVVARRLLRFEINGPMFCVGSRAKKCKPSPPACVQQINQRDGETHDDKNYRLGRPMGPWIIYKPQLQSFMSITHRITGTAFSVYLMTFAGCALMLPYTFNEVVENFECLELPQYALWFLRFCLAFPYIYHSTNGIRHLIWDTGYMLGMNQVRTTGMAWFLIVTAITGAVVFAL